MASLKIVAKANVDQTFETCRAKIRENIKTKVVVTAGVWAGDIPQSCLESSLGLKYLAWNIVEQALTEAL